MEHLDNVCWRRRLYPRTRLRQRLLRPYRGSPAADRIIARDRSIA
jgi:hypothetical protein